MGGEAAKIVLNTIKAVKLLLIASLLAISLLYCLHFGSLHDTLLTRSTWKYPVGEAAVVGLCGAASVLVPCAMRFGMSGVKRHLITAGAVAGVLGTFAIAKEMSGFNEWISDGALPYHGTHTKSLFSSDEPFVNSTFAVMVGMLLFLGAAVFVALCKKAWDAHTAHPVSGIHYEHEVHGSGVSFILETLGVIGLNVGAVLLTPVVRTEKFNVPTTYGMAMFMAAVSLSLQLMFQYSGVYESL